jgi:hypothetical protein
MASPERELSRVSPGTPSVEARLAGLEEEAARLRAQVAALQDEIRWLTGDEDDDRAVLSDGWLARGWVRASMLMAVVGLVAFVSVPYVLHLFEAPAHRPDPAAAEAGARSATVSAKAAAPEYIPAPVRVRSAEIPAPVYVRPRPAAAAPRADR